MPEKKDTEQMTYPHAEEIIAISPLMKKIMADVKKIAKSNASVFISGESGTGKEEIAKAIHTHSKRKCAPFIKVNCAAIPETLIESEFFGHERGAFTGASARKLGRFERADKGTLLLDEISEVPLSFQAKLLRATQEREFDRVGGVQPVHFDTRFISTSNRDMLTTIKRGNFREDLYYRLNVVPIHLPPLRDRREDILPLAWHFMRLLGGINKRFSSKAEEMLQHYSWPGNIRELKNVIERTLVMSTRELIDVEELSLKQSISVSEKILTLEDVERAHILKILAQHNQNRTHTARSLGISLRTLRNKLTKYRSNR